MLSENIIAEVIKLKKKNAFNYQIKLYLNSAGINEEEHQTYIHTAVEKINFEINQIATKIWLGATIVLAFAAFFLVPFETYNKAPLIVCLIAGFLISYALTQFLIYKFKWEAEKGIYRQSLYIVKFRIPYLIFGILFALLFSKIHQSTYQEKITNNGIETEALITKKSITIIKKITVHLLHIQFVHKKGKIVSTSVKAPKENFHLYNPGQKVKIKYDPDQEHVIQLVN